MVLTLRSSAIVRRERNPLKLRCTSRAAASMAVSSFLSAASLFSATFCSLNMLACFLAIRDLDIACARMMALSSLRACIFARDFLPRNAVPMAVAALFCSNASTFRRCMRPR